MKKYYYIYLIALAALITGCSKDSAIEKPEVDPKVYITMNIFNSATSRATPYAAQDEVLGGAEYVIDHLRVYVFASDGSLDKMVTYEELNADHLIVQKIEVPKGISKMLYFVANEPASVTSQLENITSEEELKEIGHTIAAAMNGGFNAGASFSRSEFLMPMSAIYDVKSALNDINIYVGLDRVVSRVDLCLRKGEKTTSRVVKLDATTTLSASNKTREGYIFGRAIGKASDFEDLTTQSSDVTLTTSEYKRVLSFYTAERTYDLAKGIKIGVDNLIDGESTINDLSVTLGKEKPLTKLERNHIYRINGTYDGVEIVADDFEIMDWEDVEVDAEIEGVMVAVDSEVAMDWLLNGNSYTSKNISFGSNKPISFYLPVTKIREGETIPGYEFKLFEFADMSSGKTYDLKTIALANNYIFATKWIESATIHFTSPQSGYISFEYYPVKVNYNTQIYPIRIKSDNVVKQMRAVYDNGYIPASMLSPMWAERAPGGVIFAKRGEAKHPTSTPEILYRDEDGFYRGEYSTTAADADRYCKEKFGKTWYMPSHDDMKKIAELYDKLGVSYRFQNNGSAEGSGDLTDARYWTNTESDDEIGWYWTSDFIQREYILEGLMELRESSESHFVRCVMDLK